MEPRRMNRFLWGGAFVAAVGCGGCGTDAPDDAAAKAPRIAAPAFSADSAYANVAAQVAFGPRVPNSAAHRACGDYLIAELTRRGLEVTVQEGKVRAYDGTLLDMRNIVGSYKPEAAERILLYAHWDTRPFADKDTLRQREPIDGANDGGSGVGVLLEVARHLTAENGPDVGVDIVFFDAEDYGRPEWAPRTDTDYRDWCLGSQYWAAQPHKVGYRAKFGILLDMVGARDAVFNQEGTSLVYAPTVVTKVWNAARDLGYSHLFRSDKTPQTVDDNLFVSEIAGIPSVNIVHYQVTVLPMGYGAFHHTHRDNMDIIDPKTLDAVGKVVMDVVWNE